MGEEGMRDATGANAAGTGCATSPATHIAWVPSLTVACFALHLAWHFRLFEGIGQHGQPDGIEMSSYNVTPMTVGAGVIRSVLFHSATTQTAKTPYRLPLLVGCLGQREGLRGEPFRLYRHRPERVADDVAEDFALHRWRRISRFIEVGIRP